LLALGEKESRKTLRNTARRVPVIAVRLEVARADAQKRDASREGIGNGLDDLRDRVILLVGEDLGLFAVFTGAGNGASLGRREKRDTGIQDPQGPNAERRRAAEDREDLSGCDLRLQPREDVGGLERPLGEELLHEIVFALGDHLDQLLVLLLGPLREVGRNRSVDALSALVNVALHA